MKNTALQSYLGQISILFTQQTKKHLLRVLKCFMVVTLLLLGGPPSYAANGAAYEKFVEEVISSETFSHFHNVSTMRQNTKVLEQHMLDLWNQYTNYLLFRSIPSDPATNGGLSTYALELEIQDLRDIHVLDWIAEQLTPPSTMATLNGTLLAKDGLITVGTVDVNFLDSSDVAHSVRVLFRQVNHSGLVSGSSTALSKPLTIEIAVYLDPSAISPERIFGKFQQTAEKIIATKLDGFLSNMPNQMRIYPLLLRPGEVPIEQFANAIPGNAGKNQVLTQELAQGGGPYMQLLDFADRIFYIQQHFGTPSLVFEFYPVYYDPVNRGSQGPLNPVVHRLNQHHSDPEQLALELHLSAEATLRRSNILPRNNSELYLQDFTILVVPSPANRNQNLNSTERQAAVMQQYLLTRLSGTVYTDPTLQGPGRLVHSPQHFLDNLNATRNPSILMQANRMMRMAFGSSPSGSNSSANSSNSSVATTSNASNNSAGNSSSSLSQGESIMNAIRGMVGRGYRSSSDSSKEAPTFLEKRDSFARPVSKEEERKRKLHAELGSLLRPVNQRPSPQDTEAQRAVELSKEFERQEAEKALARQCRALFK